MMLALLMAFLQTVAIQMEILDAREKAYILANPKDFQEDIGILWRRNQELADAPYVADSYRFPDRDGIGYLLAFNRAYTQRLETKQTVELSRWWWYQDAMRENDQIYQIWDTVRDARCEYYYNHVRRQALRKLRDQIGPEDYYSGQLPPFVPVWRFQIVG